MSRNAMNKQSGKGGAVALLDSAAGRILGDLEKGKFLGRVDEKLKELAKAMEELGGKGKLVVTLDFNTQSGRSASTTIMGTVAIKAPQQGPKPMVRFLHEGEFINEEPGQGVLFSEDEEDGGAGSAEADGSGGGSVVEGRFQRKAG